MSFKRLETLDRLSACHLCTNGSPAAANRWSRATQKTLADHLVYLTVLKCTILPTIQSG